MPETCRTTYVIAALSLTATGLLLAAGAEMLQSMLYTSLRLAPGRVSTSPAADTAMPRPPSVLSPIGKQRLPLHPLPGSSWKAGAGPAAAQALHPAVDATAQGGPIR